MLMGCRQRLLEDKEELRKELGINTMRLEVKRTRKKNYSSLKGTRRKKRKRMRTMTPWTIPKTSGELQDPLTPTGSEF